MELNIDTRGKEFVVTNYPAPKLDQSGEHRKVKGSDLLLWVTQVVVTDNSGGEIINIVTAGERPDVDKGDEVDLFGLVANAWATNGRCGVSYRAQDIKAVED